MRAILGLYTSESKNPNIDDVAVRNASRSNI